MIFQVVLSSFLYTKRLYLQYFTENPKKIRNHSSFTTICHLKYQIESSGKPSRFHFDIDKSRTFRQDKGFRHLH